MFTKATEFVSRALMEGVECSVLELASLSEFTEVPTLKLLEEISIFCSESRIHVEPPLDSPTAELDTLRRFVRQRTPNLYEEATRDAISRGECHKVEFKETLGLDLRRRDSQPSASKDDLVARRIVHEVVKTICAFLNSDGGVLLIGVDDDGNVKGIEEEFSYMKKSKDLDGWQLYFGDQVSSLIYDYGRLSAYIYSAPVLISGKTVFTIVVDASPSKIAVCAPSKKGDEDCVYKRDGNRSTQIRYRDFESFVNARQHTNARDTL